MAGQQHGLNTERNCARHQEQNARKRAFQPTSGVHMAHMVVDDVDPRMEQQKEEVLQHMDSMLCIADTSDCPVLFYFTYLCFTLC